MNGFCQSLFRTDPSAGLLILRVCLGLVIFPHGAQKLLGWFGGHGFKGTMGFFTQQMKIPAVFAILAIVAEFFGSLGLILGFATRVAAFGITAVMLVAVLTSHVQHGFFMNWMGDKKGEGYEFHILAVAICVILIMYGGGLYSVDLALYG